MNEILWQPDPERVRASRMFRFLQAVNESFDAGSNTYADLHRWSVEHLEEFWEFYRRRSGIHFHEPPRETLSSRKMPGARWFSGAALNYAENLLRGPSEKTAIFSKAETRPLARMTFGELREEVARFAAALKQAGVNPGDRVAGLLPNIPETIVAMLGTAAVGGVWSSCSPDFGPQGVKDRFCQIEPKVLIAVDGYTYNGKPYPVLETVDAVAGQCPGLQRLVILPFLEDSVKKKEIHFPAVDTWAEWTRTSGVRTPDFQPVEFNHPLCILYSSGTTGLPKCIVHGTGGTLLQHHKEHALHTDIGPEDVVFYYTTCGWMMWNWLASVLAQQAAIVLYEGSPAYPSLGTLWELVEETGITVFGTSPKFIAWNQVQQLQPPSWADVGSLKSVLSTGAPLDPENFRWIYRHVKEDLQLSSISGGTDIISCFMLGNPMLPVRAGEIQCLGLGMDVAALDENHRPVQNRKGELACLSPAPSMPLEFWKDPEGRRYREAYFDQVPGVWIHGDFIEIRETGGVVVYGRSDATLNPGGVRIGTAEVYRVVENLEEIEDSLVLGVEEGGDIRILLFVVPREGHPLEDGLRQKIRASLRKQASPRHVPNEIYAVSEVPRTLNGKKVELTVQKIFKGEPVRNESALANAGCLAQYRDIYSSRRASKQD